jgi:hypothetical protein
MSISLSLLTPLAGLLVLATLLLAACIREAHLLYNYMDQFSVFSRHLPRPSWLRALGMALPIVLFGGLIPLLVSLFLQRNQNPPLVGSHVLTCALLQFPFTFIVMIFVFHRLLPASPRRSLKVAGCLFGLLIPVLGVEWLLIKVLSRLLPLYGVSL